jgi:putative hydrolase of the HAD superfamily
VTGSAAAAAVEVAVILDLDDTLVEDIGTVEASYEEVRRHIAGGQGEGSWQAMREAIRVVWRAGPEYRLRSQLGIASWEGLWPTFEGNDPVLDGVKEWLPTYRQEAWTAALAALGLSDPDLVPIAEKIFVEAQAAGHPLLPGAGQTVRRLSGRHRLGLLTNGPSDNQRRKLEQSGLATQFECVAISGEMGVGKPDGAAFVAVLGRLGVAPSEAVMVGDSWHRDIEGALAAGIPSVWIAAGRPVPAAHAGVTVIASIEELVDVLH